MRATPATRCGPVARDPRRPPGRARSHRRWTDRRGLVTATYNAAGQMTADTNPAAGNGTYTYAGPDQTTLVSQTVPGSASVSYGYGRTNSSGLPIIESVTKVSGSTTLNGYIDNDAGGTPEVFTTDTGQQNYYVPDGATGSPIALINTSGTQTGAYAYDPYGTYTTTASVGSAAGLNPARFAGGLYDRTTGDLHYGQRWYDPTIGRFTQQDSVSHIQDLQQENRYAYAGDDPINNIDPTGEFFGEGVLHELADGVGVTVGAGVGGAIAFIPIIGGPLGAGVSVCVTQETTQALEGEALSCDTDLALGAAVAGAVGEAVAYAIAIGLISL